LSEIASQVESTRQLIDPALLPMLSALIVLYFVDQLRLLTSLLPLTGRLVFAAEMSPDTPAQVLESAPKDMWLVRKACYGTGALDMIRTVFKWFRIFPLMNLRLIMDGAFYSEWAILRYSAEPKPERITMPPKQQGHGVPFGQVLMTGHRHRSFLQVAAAVALAAVFSTPASRAEPTDAGDWIETWTASPQPIWDADFFAPINIPRALRNQTVRQIARVSIGGNRVRVVLSNEYGSRPLVIGAAHVALAGSNAAIVADSDRALTFDGRSSVTKGLSPDLYTQVLISSEAALPRSG